MLMLAEMQCPHSEARVRVDTRDAGVMEKLLVHPGLDKPAFTKHTLPKKAFEESKRRHQYNQQA